MSRWNTESNNSASWVFQALAALSTISCISAAACIFFAYVIHTPTLSAV